MPLYTYGSYTYNEGAYMLGITVVPYVGKDGEPTASIVIAGMVVDADRTIVADAEGVELAFSADAAPGAPQAFYLVDARGADAVSG